MQARGVAPGCPENVVVRRVRSIAEPPRKAELHKFDQHDNGDAGDRLRVGLEARGVVPVCSKSVVARRVRERCRAAPQSRTTQIRQTCQIRQTRQRRQISCALASAGCSARCVDVVVARLVRGLPNRPPKQNFKFDKHDKSDKGDGLRVGLQGWRVAPRCPESVVARRVRRCCRAASHSRI